MSEITQRQSQVLALAAKGYTSRGIAIRLGISAETVKVHIRNIMDTLEAQNRTEAVAIALRQGLLDA